MSYLIGAYLWGKKLNERKSRVRCEAGLLLGIVPRITKYWWFCIVIYILKQNPEIYNKSIYVIIKPYNLYI